MKRNVQTHQELKNWNSSNAILPILSFSFLFIMMLMISPANAVERNNHNQNVIEQNSFIANENRTSTDTVAFICQGESFYNVNYPIAGTYSGWYATSPIDTVYYFLTVNPTYSILIDTSICEGFTYNFFGQLISQSGVYTKTFTSVNGCDSSYILNLSVNDLPNPHIFGIPNNYTHACGGDLTPRCYTEENQTDYEWTVVGGVIVAPYDYNTNQPITDSTWIIVRWNEEVNNNASISVNYKNSNGCSAIVPTTYYFTIGLPIHIVAPIIYDTICEDENYIANGFYLYNMPAGIYDTAIQIDIPVSTATPCGGDTTKTLRLFVISEPNVVIIPNDTSIYAHQSVTLCVEDSGLADSLETTYVWTWLNGGTATGPCITVSPMQNTSYMVTATNIYGCWDMSVSAIVRVLTYFDTPNNLQITTVDCRPILTWEAPDFPYGFGFHLGYVIYLDGVKIAQVGTDVFTYTDYKKPAGTYNYCVTALYTYPYNPDQVESDPICFSYVSPIPQYLNPPLNVYAYPSYDCNVVVIWDAPENTCWGELVGYNIYRNKNGVYEKLWTNLSPTNLVFIDDDVHIKGQEYNYCVQAVYANFTGVSNFDDACYQTTIDCGLAVNIFPNPADLQVTVVANDMDYIKIYDIIGRYITTIYIPTEYCHEYTFSTENWKPDMYLFKIYFIDDVMPAEIRKVAVAHQ